MQISYVQLLTARREEGDEISLMKFIRELDRKMEFLEMDLRYGYNVI